MKVKRDRYEAFLGSKMAGPEKGVGGRSGANTDTKVGYRLRTQALTSDKLAENMDNDMPNIVKQYEDDGTLPPEKKSNDLLFAGLLGLVAFLIAKYIL